MVRNFKKILLLQNDKNYLEWLFPQSKSTLLIGLVATLMVTTALSLEHYFYSYYEEHKQISISEWVMIPSIFIRIIIFPIINIATIFLAVSEWNNQLKKSNTIGVSIILIAVLSIFIHSCLEEDYLIEDYAYEILPLIIFTQILYGLSFRTNFYLSLGIVISILVYTIGDGKITLELIWTDTFILVLWISLFLGNVKLEQYRVQNFNNIFDLATAKKQIEAAHKKIQDQEHLLRSGERVSQLCSFRFAKESRKISFSDGIYDLLNLQKNIKSPETIFQLIQNLTHPDDKSISTKQIYDLNCGVVRAYSPYRIICSNGATKWLKMVVQNMKEEGFIYGTIQDVTKEITLQHELQEKGKTLKLKNEALQQFAYASSHDLQEPLRTITNFVGILDKKIGDQLDEQNRMFMKLIKDSAHRMSNLILAILDYSRIGKNKNLTHFDCNEILEDVMKDLNFSIMKNKGKIIIEDPLPSIIAYRSEFTMLIQNLIGNALKFRKKDIDPIITIRSYSDEEYHHFCIQDNGIGMEQKNATRIFQLFSRLHNKDKYEGSGIGLTHSRKIIELHDGKIWVESALGQGSSFHFNISRNLKIENNEKEFELHNAN